jgi:hypothetical protein
LYSETFNLPNPRERKSRSTKLRQAIDACCAIIFPRSCTASSMPGGDFTRLQESGITRGLLAHLRRDCRAVGGAACTRSSIAGRGFSRRHQCC